MAARSSVGSLQATAEVERGLLPGVVCTLPSRHRDFLACRHHVEACRRRPLACHHAAAVVKGAVRKDSALFFCPASRSAHPVHSKGRR